MSIVFESVALSPSKVNAGQGYILQVKVIEIALLLDIEDVILHDSTGVYLIARQEVKG